MKSIKKEATLVSIGYFLFLLFISLSVRDIPFQPDVFNTTLQQLIKTSPMADPASFATAAIDIAENGWISGPNSWILNLWPPGFILLEALIIKICGALAPAILVLQVLAAALYTVVLFLLYSILKIHFRSLHAFALPLTVFAFPVSRVFLLEPTGITLGESYAIGFFLIAIFLSYRSVQQNSARFAVYAGLSLALSAYFRSQFEIILLILSFWGVLFAIAIKLTPLRKSIQPQLASSTLKTIAVALLVAHAATIPWRAYHWVYQGSPQWVQTSSVTFGNSVRTSEYLESVHGAFVVAGGGNLVCRIDPTTCDDTANAKKLFIKTFLEHPVEWYSLKFDVIGQYWFSSVRNWSAVGIEATFIDYVTNSILLLSIIALIFLLFTRKVRTHDSWALLLWFNTSLFSAYLLIFTVQQFEVRYFYFPKIAGLAMLLLVASLYWRSANASK